MANGPTFGAGTQLCPGRCPDGPGPAQAPQPRPMQEAPHMAKDALVTDELAKKFATEKDTPYVRWVRGRGAGHHRRALGARPADRRAQAVGAPRRRRRLHQPRGLAHVQRLLRGEIPAGGELDPQRQLFEEMILVLEGHGSTPVWNDAGDEVTFEWGPGSLFAIPLNAWHQHFNGSGSAPARFVSSTNLPPIINLYEDAGLRLRHRPRLPVPLRRRGGLLRRRRMSRRACCCGPTSSPTRSACR